MLKALPGVGAAAALLIGLGATHAQEAPADERMRAAVREVIAPLMDKHAIPGMAVAVTIGGRHVVVTEGVAGPASRDPVTERTLFEIGSLSKTFTATLGALAAERGALALGDPADRFMPALAGSAAGRATMLDLATYAAGGLPLQFPDAVDDPDAMIAFYRDWQPDFPPGSHRLYSNPSIGLFGHLAAGALGEPFERAMEGELLPALGLRDTVLSVPAARMGDYSFGTSRSGEAIRVNPGTLDAEAYGIKSTAGDMIRFVDLAMGAPLADDALAQALRATRTGYYAVGPMIQGLGWEMYDQPASLGDLLAGNATEMALEPHAVARLDPPRPPRDDVWANKTGSTGGFGAYAAFVPAERIGIVLLANRNYPIPDRVEAAYRILEALGPRAD